MKTLKLLGINLLVLLVVLALVFVAGEGYLRLSKKIESASVSAVGIRIFQNSEVQGFEHKPGAKDYNGYGEPTPLVQIDDLGLRDGDEVFSRGEKNVLLLGDSFTFATGVSYENSFAGKLEQKLGEGWAVANAGVVGYTLDNHYLALQKYFDAVQPDVVVINTFVGNDVTEFRRHAWVLNNEELVSTGEQEVFVDEEGRLRNWTQQEPASYFWYFLVERYEVLKVKLGWQAAEDPTLTWPVFVAEGAAGYDSRLPQFWDKYFQMMEKIRIFCDKHEVELVVNLIPMDVQVSREYWGKYAVAGAVFGEEAFEAKRPQVKIMDYCDRMGLSCLDLLPLFQENVARDNLYFRQNEDPHFDLLGHEVTAEALFNFIKKHE